MSNGYGSIFSHSGTKSYQNLLVDVYGGERTSGASSESFNLDSPFNFTRTGYYNITAGDLTSESLAGSFWENEIYYENHARLLRFYRNELIPQYANGKGYGFSLRYLVRWIFLLRHQELSEPID